MDMSNILFIGNSIIWILAGIGLGYTLGQQKAYKDMLKEEFEKLKKFNQK